MEPRKNIDFQLPISELFIGGHAKAGIEKHWFSIEKMKRQWG
jgi:hypothetical protein